MKKILLSLLVISIFSVIIIPTVNCATYYRVIWNPEASRLNLKLEYPDEAHRGDIVTFKLDMFWWEDRLVNEFDVYVSYYRDDGTWQSLYSTNLYTNVQVVKDEANNFSFDVEIPQHAFIHPFSIQIGISVRTNDSPLLDSLEVYATAVVEKTRTELQNELTQSSISDSQVVQDFNDYKQTHSYSDSEYDTLSSDFDQYKETHSYTNSEYNSLLSQNNTVDSGNSQSLVYLLMISVVVIIILVVTTIYFARKKHKTN